MDLRNSQHLSNSLDRIIQMRENLTHVYDVERVVGEGEGVDVCDAGGYHVADAGLVLETQS